MADSDIIVIGGSAGALEPLTEILRELPRDFPAAIFVVIHTAPNSEGALPQILERNGILPARFPADGEPIEYGKIYVAPPDQHLEVAGGKVVTLRGPRENGFRPAIDPLFRSAARSFDGRVTGVLLSGAMDDGTFGLLAIKQAGGAAMVQHPYEALIPALPMNAIQNVEVDKIVRAKEIGQLLAQRGAPHSGQSGERPAPSKSAASAEPASDRDISLAGNAPDKVSGSPSFYTCPECGGALWEAARQGEFRFRCHTGHGFTPETLAAQQGVEFEHALWSAVRVLQERAALHRRMAEQAELRGMKNQALRSHQLAEEQAGKAQLLRRVLDEPTSVPLHSLPLEIADPLIAGEASISPGAA